MYVARIDSIASVRANTNGRPNNSIQMRMGLLSSLECEAGKPLFNTFDECIIEQYILKILMKSISLIVRVYHIIATNALGCVVVVDVTRSLRADVDVVDQG